jgi:hypothetical protein
MARRHLFALFECKISSFFSNSNGFMQKNSQKFAHFILYVYICPRQRAIETSWWLSVGSSCVPSVASAKGDDFDKQITAEFTKGLRFYPKLQNNS